MKTLAILNTGLTLLSGSYLTYFLTSSLNSTSIYSSHALMAQAYKFSNSGKVTIDMTTNLNSILGIMLSVFFIVTFVLANIFWYKYVSIKQPKN